MRNSDNRVKKDKKVRAVPIGIGVLVFIVSFFVGAGSKLAIQPSWAKKYSVQLTETIGRAYKDISYGIMVQLSRQKSEIFIMN